eukprot:SAG11_NODE_924_length_6525_cov_5.604264_4_plen_79_part_00
MPSVLTADLSQGLEAPWTIACINDVDEAQVCTQKRSADCLSSSPRYSSIPRHIAIVALTRQRDTIMPNPSERSLPTRS